MPAMSRVEQVWCRSLPWRAFTRRVVFPWAIGDVARVLRPGGIVAEYDLVEPPVSRLTHRLDRSPHRMATADGLQARLVGLPFDDVTAQPALAGLVTRFRARRTEQPHDSTTTHMTRSA